MGTQTTFSAQKMNISAMMIDHDSSAMKIDHDYDHDYDVIENLRNLFTHVTSIIRYVFVYPSLILRLYNGETTNNRRTVNGVAAMDQPATMTDDYDH